MTRAMKWVLACGLLVGCAVVGCFAKNGKAPHRVGAVSAGIFHTIPFDYNPSVSGWPGAVGDIVQNAGSTSAWVRTGTADTAWQAFPGSGGGSGTIADGGVAAPLSGNGSTASPLGISIADQTVLGNVSGGVGPAVGLSKTQELTRLGITPYTDRRSAVTIRAQALAGNTLTVPICHEGDYSVGWVSTVSNGGSTLMEPTAQGGVIACKTNASSSAGQCQVSWSSLVSPGGEILNSKTSLWYVAALVKMVTAVDSGSEIDFQLNAADLGNTAFRIGQAGAKSTTHWRVFIADGSGATIINAAVAAAIDTNWHLVEVVNDGTNITEYIDTVQQNQNADTAFASGNPLFPQLFVNNGSLNNRQMDIDYVCTVTPSNSPISGQP